MKTVILLLVGSVACWAQTPGARRYEVTSVKPSHDVTPYTFRIEPNGSLTATGITLKRLMMTAWNVQDYRIVGGPDWVSSRSWDVQAKPERAAASGDEIRQMLRTLLEDRFSLHARLERRNLPLYELEVDTRGAKVPRPKAPDAKPIVEATAGSIRLTRNTSATFASQLSYSLERPVIDKTGLSGEFDFYLQWAPQPAYGQSDGPDIFTAIREQLGLQLKAGRGPVDVLVIDSAQLPSPN